MYYLIFCLGILFGCCFELAINKFTSVFGEIEVFEKEDEEYQSVMRVPASDYDKIPEKRNLVLRVRIKNDSLNGNKHFSHKKRR